jgi:hypothetical protein
VITGVQEGVLPAQIGWNAVLVVLSVELDYESDV